MRDRARFAADLSEAALASRGDSDILLVGLTGMEGSGVHELAQHFVQDLSLKGETPVIVTLRDFMWPEEEWLPEDPEKEAQAYYSRAFGLELLVTSVLEPLRAGESVDLEGNGLEGPWSILVDPDDILVLCGPFLMRSEVRRFLDFLVHVDPSAKAAKARAAERGVPFELYMRRYLPAEHIYTATHPAVEYADVIVDLAVPSSPSVLWKRGG